MSENCILVITQSRDTTVDYLIERYTSNAITFCRFNIDQLTRYEIAVGDEDEWRIRTSDWTLQLNQTQSIYYRKPMLPDVRSYAARYREMIETDIIALIDGIVDSFSGKVLSRPSLLRLAENKTLQLLYAIRHHITTPASCISNSKTILNEFEQEYSELVIKPLSIGDVRGEDVHERFFTSIFHGSIQDVSITPIYIQEYIPKKFEARITIVGDDVFAVRVESENRVDWRQDPNSTRFTHMDCPATILRMCNQIMKDFDLRFGAFDFIVTLDERWIFLEVNPNGQWLWLERMLDLPISKAIVSELTRI